MRQEDIWNTETAQRYDTDDRGMFAPEVLGPAVDRLAALAGPGPALEFAVATEFYEDDFVKAEADEVRASADIRCPVVCPRISEVGCSQPPHGCAWVSMP